MRLDLGREFLVVQVQVLAVVHLNGLLGLGEVFVKGQPLLLDLEVKLVLLGSLPLGPSFFDLLGELGFELLVAQLCGARLLSLESLDLKLNVLLLLEQVLVHGFLARGFFVRLSS